MLSCSPWEVGTKIRRMARRVEAGGALRSESADATNWRGGCFPLSPSQSSRGQTKCWGTGGKAERQPSGGALSGLRSMASAHASVLPEFIPRASQGYSPALFMFTGSVGRKWKIHSSPTPSVTDKKEVSADSLPHPLTAATIPRKPAVFSVYPSYEDEHHPRGWWVGSERVQELDNGDNLGHLTV